MTGRREEILALVSELKKIEVNDLAERLSVSKVTIRKDLDALEKRGLLHREHGFAVLNSQDDLNYRLALNYDKKVQIAKLAAKEVANGETIMIESGSSCAILAEIISKTKKDVTIITNSSFIAHYVSNEMNCQIVLLGGNYQQDAQVTVGPLAKKSIQNFFVDKVFIGIDGFDRVFGFSNSDMLRSEVVQTMATVAKRVIVLTDSTKFYERGLIKTLDINEVDTIYTDGGLDEDTQRYLESKAVTVVTTK